MPSSLRVVGDPFCRGDRVIGGGGKFVLGREAVIDRDHDQRACIGELAADDVVGVEIADHPAAAMEEHQRRRKPVLTARLLRHVDAGRDRAVRRRDRQRRDARQFRRLGVGGEAGLRVIGARFRCVSVS